MMHHYYNKKAFTLAEVLITLGIIGVVAALTLPSVINKFKIKQLETAFKRSSSIITNALNLTAVDYGYNNFKEFNQICGTINKGKEPEKASVCVSSNQALFADISNSFISKFNVVKTLKPTDLRKYQATNFSNTTTFVYNTLYGMHTFATPHAALYILSDGTAISAVTFFYHEPSDGVSFTFDTNGPAKGPNRYGYDIFLYNTGTWYKQCSKNTNGAQYNGRGCYDYALKDVNPDDDSKGYWESL